MPPQPPPKGPKRASRPPAASNPRPQSPPPPPRPAATRRPVSVPTPARPAAAPVLAPVPPIVAAPSASGELGLGVAVSGGEAGGVVTARRAGGLRDLALQVDPDAVGIKGALQHLAKAVNIAFQADYGENFLEAVYQAAIVRNGEVHIIHKEYFGFRDTWFGQFGMLLRSMQLSLQGPDPVSPEGQRRIAEKGPASIRGLLNLIGRKLDLVTEFEDRVPAYVEQMFDRLEASGIIVGWDRADWEIWTTKVGLDIRITPQRAELERRQQQEVPGWA